MQIAPITLHAAPVRRGNGHAARVRSDEHASRPGHLGADPVPGDERDPMGHPKRVEGRGTGASKFPGNPCQERTGNPRLTPVRTTDHGPAPDSKGVCMRLVRRATLLGILMALFLQGNAFAATVNVSAMEFSFTPSLAKVKMGDTIHWTNNGTVVHTSTHAGATSLAARSSP